MAFASSFAGTEYRSDNGAVVINYPCTAELRATLPAGTMVKLDSAGLVVKATKGKQLYGVVMHQVNGLNVTIAIGIRGFFNALPLDPSNLPSIGEVPFEGAGTGFVEFIEPGKDMISSTKTTAIANMLRLSL
jgi:hypothetical protein